MTKLLVYNARKCQEGAIAPTPTLPALSAVPGCKNCAFKNSCPMCCTGWGLTRIDRFVSMSDMKYNALVRSGIEILERVGHIGLYRDPQTLRVIEYFFKVLEDLSDRDVLVVDPMIATDNTAVAALYPLKQARPRSPRFLWPAR